MIENAAEARALILALKHSGIVKVYCRYDGGNDEGFAWVDHAVLTSGQRLNPLAVAQHLLANGLPEPARLSFQRNWPVERVLHARLDFPLATNWAAALLGGRGFGTGEYSMYGAFVADLVTETITDDPAASAVVQNIDIEGCARVESSLNPPAEPDDGARVETRPPAYQVGVRVKHAHFGSGTITAIDGSKLTITFDEGTERRIVDSFIQPE